jgi:uncharacterized protein YkwD
VHARDMMAVRKPAAALVLAFAFAALAATAPIAARADASAPAAQMRVARALTSPVLQLINAERRKHGLRPLKLCAPLGKAALAHARSMGRHGFFSHDSYDGTSPGARLRRYFRGSAWGETLLWRAPDLTPQQAVQMWLRSAPHREILLSPGLTEVGFGAVHVANGTGVFAGLDPTILVADFGAP